MDKLSDSALIELTLAGRDEAFAVLLRRYEREVFAAAYRAVGNRIDAEDLCQEVFIRVYRHLVSFHRDAPFRPWLHRITYNRILTFLKGRAARRETQEGGLPEHASRVPGPERNAEITLALERMTAEITSLPEPYRDVLVMRNLMGMTYQEISGALGTSLANVKSNLFRARKALRERQRDLLVQLSQV